MEVGIKWVYCGADAFISEITRDSFFNEHTYHLLVSENSDFACPAYRDTIFHDWIRFDTVDWAYYTYVDSSGDQLVLELELDSAGMVTATSRCDEFRYGDTYYQTNNPMERCDGSPLDTLTSIVIEDANFVSGFGYTKGSLLAVQPLPFYTYVYTGFMMKNDTFLMGFFGSSDCAQWYYRGIDAECGLVSTYDPTSKNSIAISPNPAEDELHFTSEVPISRIVCTDMSGRSTVLQHDGQSADLSAHEPGLYFLTFITMHGEKSVVKVMIE